MTDLVRKRSITIAGHRTSFSLEEAFWQELQQIAQREGHSVAEMVALIDEGREGNLSSALRLYVLGDLQRRLKMAMQAQSGVSPSEEGLSD
ncbi:ribbon-helix-helix domain-containing protein [Thalassospira profundimaris]|uniref:ribbon-helix-helix domain-containing protein n=1 Tax=Thalassospira profundimaris TaxID=502049 RepID=UPI000DEDF4AF|nr:ribbon-helix-helix domain-containing protein [Thalassospira profundimaris]